MLEPLLGSTDRERALIYLFARERGYAREIALYFKTNSPPIQRQLDKLEAGGVIVSTVVGRTRVYQFNPRYPFLSELKALLEKTLDFYPETSRNRLLKPRKRPRARGKPL